MSTLKAMKSSFERSYGKQNITLIVISYEIYQTSLRQDHLCNFLYMLKIISLEKIHEAYFISASLLLRYGL